MMRRPATGGLPILQGSLGEQQVPAKIRDLWKPGDFTV